MKNLLHITASPRATTSHSRRAAQQVITSLQESSTIKITVRDIAAIPPPHPDAAFVAASLTPPDQHSAEHKQVLALSETLISELELADAVLISSPMHNFMLPSTLKAWVDHVVRPHRTFTSTPQGKRGLLQDKPVALLLACGGAVAGDSATATGMQTDWATPYLRYVFQTMGIHNFQAIALQNCNRDTSLQTPSLDQLKDWQHGWPW